MQKFVTVSQIIVQEMRKVHTVTRNVFAVTQNLVPVTLLIVTMSDVTDLVKLCRDSRRGHFDGERQQEDEKVETKSSQSMPTFTVATSAVVFTVAVTRHTFCLDMFQE
jgi:hypothetical protein